MGGLLLTSPFLVKSNHTSSIHLSSLPAATATVKKKTFIIVKAAVAVSNAQTRDRIKLKQLFQQAYQRCRTSPYQGVPFTLQDFLSAIDKYDHYNNSQIATKVKGTVFSVDGSGAFVDLTAKSSAFLPLTQASVYPIKHVEEAGIVPGVREEFVIIGQNEHDDTLILSLRQIQYDLAWERCRQLLAENVVVTAKLVAANKAGLEAIVEGLRGFIPFSQISSKSSAEELLDKNIPLKFVEVDEEQSRLVLSNHKAMANTHTQLGIGSVVTGTVQSLKQYGAFIDIGGINGLLHVSQISHDRVSDIATLLQPGDTLKVMVLSHDRERGRLSLSTKKLEPTPGDMIRNPKLVFEKAEETAQTFRQRIAQAEAVARADLLRFQPESELSLNSNSMLGPLTSDLAAESVNEIPSGQEEL